MPDDTPRPSPDEVRAELRQILDSPSFQNSKRCRQFLTHVCDRALSGDANALKERSVAMDVFGRQAELNLGVDTIVRVTAREVRKRLAQYYVNAGGVPAVRVDLPPGSYVPVFRYSDPAPRSMESTPAQSELIDTNKDEGPVPKSLKPANRRFRRLAVALAALVVVISSAFMAAKLTGSNSNQDAFTRFWAPVFESRQPLLIAVAHPLVYRPSSRSARMSPERPPALTLPLQRVIQAPANPLDGGEVVPVPDQFVGFGDMVAGTEVSALLARRSKAVRIALASTIPFSQLQKTPTLLVGALTNRWTMELQTAWKLQFAWTPERKPLIVDRGGGDRQWIVPAKDHEAAPEAAPKDYILISRISNSVTGGTVLVAAGLKQFGTEAAGRLLTDPEQLGGVLQKLPAGWESRNLQLLMQVTVIDSSPAQPELVAWQIW